MMMSADDCRKISKLCKIPHIAAVSTTVLTLTIIIIMMMTVSSMNILPAAASTTVTTTNDNASTTTTTTTALQPVYQELRRPISTISINETHMSVTYSGNGSLILPETGETINTTSDGSAVVSLVTQSAVGSQTLRTEEGATATVIIHEILPSEPVDINEEPRGIAIAIIHNLTGNTLEPFNGMVLVGTDEISPDDNHLTFWESQSVIELLLRPTTTATTAPAEESPHLANAPLVTEAEEEQQEQQLQLQQQATIPAPLLQ
jgi:hypothetical protein